MPQLGKIIGTIWATQKYDGFESSKMQILQPISGEGEKIGKPIIAVDAIGAGQGETVLYITAYEAVIAYGKGMIPIDASIIGIVDNIHIDKKL